MSLRIDGTDQEPVGLEWVDPDRLLRLRYATGATADIAVEGKATHVCFEVVDVASQHHVELVSWGPYPTTIGETIGETVGVVRDQDFAIGIQALNARTLGGRPCRDDDVMPSYDIFDSGDYADVSLDFKDRQLYRGDVAVATDYGSALQAFCRDRSQERVISNWGHDQYVAPVFADGGVIGSRIALFGCPTDQVMATLEAIEIEEGLPHPLIDGQWAKTSRQATAAYVIMDFGEDTIDQAIATTRAAGLEYLYHSSPFDTWGHFQLRSDCFPNSWEGFRACVDKATRSGVKLLSAPMTNAS